MIDLTWNFNSNQSCHQRQRIIYTNLQILSRWNRVIICVSQAQQFATHDNLQFFLIPIIAKTCWRFYYFDFADASNIVPSFCISRRSTVLSVWSIERGMIPDDRRHPRKYIYIRMYVYSNVMQQHHILREQQTYTRNVYKGKFTVLWEEMLDCDALKCSDPSSHGAHDVWLSLWQPWPFHPRGSTSLVAICLSLSTR